MKKLFLLITGLVVLCSSPKAQTINAKGITDSKYRINKAASLVQQKSATTGLQNGNFEAWTVDSLETLFGSKLYFEHPEMWTPLNGFIFSIFFGVPIPISAEYNPTTSNTAVKIEVDTMNMGSDLVTVGATNERIVNLNGEFQFNGMPGEAIFEVYATKFNVLADSSEIIGVGAFGATVTNGEYQSFSTAIEYMDESSIPDSFYVFATYLQGEVGTWLKFDNLAVTYQSTGISKLLSDKLSVYPNPSKDKIKLSITNGINIDHAKVQIISMDGTTVLKLDNWNLNEALDISNLSPGIYILSINDGQSVITKKISKI